jgi:integrase
MPDKLDAFLGEVRWDGLYALWHLYAWTGIRRGEGAALRVRDIDLDAGTLTVSRAVTVASYKTHISTPKSGKTRVLDFDADTVAGLRSHLRRMNEESLQRGAGRLSGDDLLFVGEDGSPMSYLPLASLKMRPFLSSTPRAWRFKAGKYGRLKLCAITYIFIQGKSAL